MGQELSPTAEGLVTEVAPVVLVCFRMLGFCMGLQILQL